MNIYRHRTNGSLIIWAYLKCGDLVSETYYFYSLSQAKSLFRKKYPASIRFTKGCNKVQWAPGILI
jgi:hypothetical protein